MHLFLFIVTIGEFLISGVMKEEEEGSCMVIAMEDEQKEIETEE